jgi:hypothetical protein
LLPIDLLGARCVRRHESKTGKSQRKKPTHAYLLLIESSAH